MTLFREVHERHGDTFKQRGGQDVVSWVENLGRPTKRLVGLTLETISDAGEAVFDADEAIGEVTRALASPTREQPVAMELLDQAVTERFDQAGALAVRIGG